MHPKQILAVFTVFTSMAQAAPAHGVEDVSAREAGELETRAATFNMYGGDGCTGSVHGYHHADGTGYRCYRVPSPKRSIHNVGSCNLRTWSGVDCRGSSAVITQSQGCRTILYGSVSVDC
ncbi:hypothetical protein N658DRAFT_526359 [Parathielavia hyrcaniae]|uniref:Uncharacterized protein n=1 Tax=Parathielavia hyrcaniae TaxID=113614 RepID=A0AAN6PX81_9PEZI|nr:hypothetical protein N658DRAFT_526359 [Parathielavia hyrcaniae]